MSNIAGKAYAMNVITPVPANLAWLQTLIFMASRALPFSLGHLLNLRLIHFARWVVIRGSDWPVGERGPQELKNDYVLFCSNFNGTWDQYIDAFSDGNPQGLDAFWYASYRYPQSIPITPFKNYIAHNQIHTGYYYNATPGSGQRDIKAALKVYKELQGLDALHPTLAPGVFRTAYNRALARVQNCLGSPGYAPIASLDTENADRNRARFLRDSAGAADGSAQLAALPPTPSVSSRKWTTTFDGGHCFLTALFPIKTKEVVDKDGLRSSPVHMVRDALAILPTAHQSPATDTLSATSPFATSTRTHFARFAVIDDMTFNGRAPADAFLDQSDRLLPNAVDQLNCSYLLLAMDVDARGEDELRVFLRAMWREMREALGPVFDNCVGYDIAAQRPEAFADFFVAHMVETTMPFNDYWPEAPPLGGPNWLLIAGVPVTVLLAVGAAICFGVGVFAPWMPWWLRALWAVLPAAAAALYAAYRVFMALGRKPFPPAPNSDLASILKALYLQRELIAFAIAQQGASADALHKAFGEFRTRVKVNDRDGPTQRPGVIPGARGA